MAETITSPDNSRLKLFRKLQRKRVRDKESLFTVEGFHLVKEALDYGTLTAVFFTSDTEEWVNKTFTDKISSGIPLLKIPQNIMKDISSIGGDQQIAAICQKSADEPVPGRRVLALENVQDPGNTGTLIRSAASFGFDTVIVEGADCWSMKSIRASQGAFFHMDIIQTKNLADYIEAGLENYFKVGAVLDKEADDYRKMVPKEPFLLVLGNEGSGISDRIADKLDKKVYIPISFESLNVASAGAVLLSEYTKK